ncbi:MAG TPA: class A beta-lactamase, subclass A2 [Pyrinomonadaceae bacterium]|nr:class A beta-lactamase, subclass A2 [Pyrinomonadaceae bacterium]
MKRKLLTYLLFLFPVASACASSRVIKRNNPTASPTASQAAKAGDLQNEQLQDQIKRIASAAQGRVGVTAVVLETGESVSLNPHDHFPMQSVYKLPIGMAVLQQVDAGRIKLEQKVSVAKSDFVRAGQHSPIRDKNPNGAEPSVDELLRFAIAESDGTASDVLMKLAGGSGAIQAYLTRLRINEMIVENTEKEIGQDWQTQYRNWASPEAAVSLLRALQERQGLSEASQALLLRLLTESIPGPKRLKGLLPAGTAVAHKTGTSGSQKGITAATNDIGIITLPNGRHLAIAVFVADSAANESTREGVIAGIARAVWDSVTSKKAVGHSGGTTQ